MFVVIGKLLLAASLTLTIVVSARDLWRSDRSGPEKLTDIMIGMIAAGNLAFVMISMAA